MRINSVKEKEAKSSKETIMECLIYSLRSANLAN
jgi:hypothetical protein